MNTDEALQLLTSALEKGGIAVVRTDTLYGIIALARIESAVERVYEAKSRNPSKQCIILITDPSDVPAHISVLDNYGHKAETPTSVIVPATTEEPWLLRGGDTIAYRVVRDSFLRSVVEKVGPVIAPSANPEGQPPARTIEEAKAYFGDDVDVYVDGGTVPEVVQASQIVQISSDGSISYVRS